MVIKWCLKLCMVWRTIVIINKNVNSKLAGTTMGKILFEGVVALERAGLVSTFRTVVYSARLQENAGLLVVVEPMYDGRDAFLGGKDRRCSCLVKRVSWYLSKTSLLTCCSLSQHMQTK